MNKRFFFSVFLATVFLTQSPLVLAEDLPSADVSVLLDAKMITQSRTVSSSDTFARLMIPSNTLRAATSIDFKQIDAIGEFFGPIWLCKIFIHSG